MAHQVNYTLDDVADMEGLNMQTLKVCVWAVFDERVAQAQRLLLAQNIVMEPILIKELGNFFGRLWQVNAPRNVGEGARDRCFLCNSTLPDVGELCSCYKAARVAVYIDDAYTLEGIKKYWALNPHSYRKEIQEVRFCVKPGCGKTFEVYLGDIEDTLRRIVRKDPAATYRSPTLCPICRQEASDKQWSRDKMQHEKQMLALQRRGAKPELAQKLEKAGMVEAILDAVPSEASPGPKPRSRDRRGRKAPQETLHTETSPTLTAAVMAAGAPPSDLADLESSPAPMSHIVDEAPLAVSEA